jgi:endonuclease/exonuclease/phosphatase (EEP) superfamily protein YafD
MRVKVNLFNASSRCRSGLVAVVDYLPTSFEMICARLTSGRFSSIVVFIYRPGSVAVQSTFFDELAAVFDGIATHQEPVFVVGDLNILRG